MKKFAFLVLAIAALFVFASTAMAAVSIDIDKDTRVLTVSSDDDDLYEIEVSGPEDLTLGLNSSVRSTSRTLTKDGTYTVKAVNMTKLESAGSKTFTLGAEATAEPTAAPTVEPTVAPTAEPTVAPTVAPTAEPTAEPTVVPTADLTLVSASYKGGTISFTASGVKAPTEIYIDGSFAGKSISSSGSHSLTVKLALGDHTMYLFTPDTMEKSGTVKFTVAYLKPVVSGASYKDGVITFTVSNNDTYCEVYVDGAFSGYGIDGEGTKTIKKELACGTHTLYVFNADGVLKSDSVSFEAHKFVTYPAVAATCTKDGKTEEIKCELCGKVQKAAEVLKALGHDIVIDAGKAVTCTEDGLTEGQHCTRCDEATVAQEKIPALGHTVVTLPAVEATCKAAGKTEGEKCSVCGTVLKEQKDIAALGHNYVVIERTAEKVVYECTRCGDTFTQKNQNTVVKDTKNAYGAIVKDANLVDVDYTANANMLDQKCLVIVADLNSKPNLTTELGLYLDDALIAQLIKEGYETVNFVNGDASIVITLKEISPFWFSTNDAIWAYVFSTDPAAVDGTLVMVEAMVSATEKVPADLFSGVIFKTVTGDLAVTENGIY